MSRNYPGTSAVVGQHYQDNFVGGFTYQPPAPPVPPFPCEKTKTCTAENRKCDAHKMVLFIELYTSALNANSKLSDTFTVPFPVPTCYLWIKEQITIAKGIPVEKQKKFIYAGTLIDENWNMRRDSRLTYGSTLRLIVDESAEEAKITEESTL